MKCSICGCEEDKGYFDGDVFVCGPCNHDEGLPTRCVYCEDEHKTVDDQDRVKDIQSTQGSWL